MEHNIPTIYDQEYLRCVKIWNTNGLTWFSRFESELNLHKFVKEKLPAYSHVLDIGCSDGVFAYRLANSRFGVTGLDASKEAIQVAKKQRELLGWSERNPDFINKRFEDFNTDRVYHFITLLEFFEHMDDLDFAIYLLTKAYDIAEKGVIVSVPIEELVPDKDHKIIFSAHKFFKLINAGTKKRSEPPPLIEYYIINKTYGNRHNMTYTPNIFVAIIKKQWVD